MTNDKKLSDLVVEVSELILEINNHPEYKEIEEKGYQHQPSAEVADAYQAMVDLNYEISKSEKVQG